MRSKLLDHLRRQWMGALALFLVLSGGTAYAANTVFSEDIVDGEVKGVDIGNNQVRSADVRDDTLAGGGLQSADLAPSSVGLGELDPAAFAGPDIAPTAGGGAFEIADNAVQGFEVSDNALTGADISERTLSVADLGCQAGLILGFARIKGSSSMPSTFTSSSTYVDTKRNCSGGTVEVKRIGTGFYGIRFAGLSAVLALGTSNLGAPTVCEDNLVSVGKFLDDTPSSFSVTSFDDDGDTQDCWVTVAVI
jgi:hypothetical protein